MANNTTANLTANVTAGQGPFNQGIILLQKLGFFDTVVPFIMVFAIVYGVLTKSKILGEEQANLNALVAFSIAILFTATASVTGVIREFLPIVGMLSVLIIAALILISLFVGDVSSTFSQNKWFPTILAITVFVVVVWVFSTLMPAPAEEPAIDVIGVIMSYLPAIFVLVFVVGIVYLFLREGGE